MKVSSNLVKSTFLLLISYANQFDFWSYSIPLSDFWPAKQVIVFSGFSVYFSIRIKVAILNNKSALCRTDSTHPEKPGSADSQVCFGPQKQ
jgi:hypothetical protein